MNSTEEELLELKHLDGILLVLRLICGKILTPCFCLLGFVANIVNVGVLTRAWMSSSTNVYLTTVALCDLFYLLFSFLFSLYAYVSMRKMATYMYTVNFIRVTANLFSNTTTWLTVCFTLERYVAVSSPILGRRFCTQQRARYVVAITTILSVIVTIPDYLGRVVETNYVKDPSNASRVIVQYSLLETAQRHYLVSIGYDYINQISFVFLPMVLLIVFNSLLVRSVFKANRGRRILVGHMTSGKYIRESSSLRERSTNTEGSTPIVKDALEASARTTVDLTSTISQSYGQSVKNSSTYGAAQTRRPILGEQQRITLMLISIVMAFVILQLPSTVPTIVDNLGKAGILQETAIRRNHMNIYSNISNLLLMINAAMNFVFYSLFSAKFRQTCCMLFRKVSGYNRTKPRLTSRNAFRSVWQCVCCESCQTSTTKKKKVPVSSSDNEILRSQTIRFGTVNNNDTQLQSSISAL